MKEAYLMKGKVGIALALSLALLVHMASASCMTSTQVTTSNMNQPMNRIILDWMEPNLPQMEVPQTTYTYDDPYLSYQWAITQTNTDLAWEAVTEYSSVVVAVIDTGVDYTHEDLVNRVLAEEGYDFVNEDSDAMDDNGHGTHVAGIIAAEANNGVGIAGIVGELNVSILPIKALDADGVGETEDIVSAILYAVDYGVDVINLSIGSNVVTRELRSAIEQAISANIFVVVAAGNDSSQCTTTSLASLDGVFTVAASDEEDSLAYFSNYGSAIDAYAPGVEILSTYLDNQYAYQDGTSMAAPIVSGAAALLLAQEPDLTVEELTDLLSNTDSTVEEPQQSTQLQQATQQQIIQIPNNTIGLTPNQQTTPTPSNQNFFIRSFVQNGSSFYQGVNQISYSSLCTTIDIYQALMAL